MPLVNRAGGRDAAHVSGFHLHTHIAMDGALGSLAFDRVLRIAGSVRLRALAAGGYD